MTSSNNYQRYFYPFIARMDAESAHERTIAALRHAQASPLGRAMLKRIAGDLPQHPVDLFGIRFPNVLGLAAGFDKDVQATSGLAALGFGHIEVGTITPRPQSGNARPRIFRLPSDGAIINRMGFPSAGVALVAPRLQSLSTAERPYVIGVSLGKQKETPLLDAAEDYILVLQAVYPYADYLAINISSPNTPELRDLQGSAYLSDLLGAIMAAGQQESLQHGPRPLLVKVAPDLNKNDLAHILQTLIDHEVAGIIATNTTISREGLQHENRVESGGLSGRPLTEKSRDIIRFIWQETGGSLPIIGVGGVETADDVHAKLDAGASLVQLYSALVYRGPGLPGSILRELAAARRQVRV